MIGCRDPWGWQVAVGQTYHFMPLSFAENMAMVLFGLIIALAARSQLKGAKS